MFQSRDPRHSHSDPRHSRSEQDTDYAYLEDMDVYDDGLGDENQWFPWVVALGLGGACIGIGLAFSWLLSPVPSTANRSRNVSEPAEIVRTDTNRNDVTRDRPDGSASQVNDLRFERGDTDLNASSNRGSNSNSGDENDNPLGIPITDLPLIPVDPAATSQVRPSRIAADLNSDDPEDEVRNRSSRDREVLTRGEELAINPDLRRDDDLWSSNSEPSREDAASRQFFSDDSLTEESVSERRRDRDDREREDDARRDDDRELVESTNVAVATPRSPRLDLGPSFGEGSYLVLMTYQGDNSLSQARKYSQGAFIKQLDGETYVQLAAFDQLEYARHMADNLRRQGVAVLILQ